MFVAILGFFLLLALVMSSLWAIDRRSRRIERNLVALMAHLGVAQSEPPAPSDEVKALAGSADGKIAAIKAYRAETGLSLVEAKEAIERLQPPGRSGSI